MNAARRTAPKPPPPMAGSTLVLGLGKTGYSVVEHLAGGGGGGGGKITVADSRQRAPCLAQVRARHPDVEVITGKLPLDSFARYERIVVSPGIAVQSDRRLVGDIELFAESIAAEQEPTPVIAITGSNGKSSVTTLVVEMLAAAGHRVLAGGNLGPPALELLAEPTPEFYVLELSSFQLENTYSLRPAAAAILNISEDHLDRHRRMESYVAAKARALEHAEVRVLNRADPASASLLRAHPDAVTFGLDCPPRAGDFGLLDTVRGCFLSRGEDALVDAASLAVHGEQNMANALAALALVGAVLDSKTSATFAPPVLDALLAWRGLEHRCELVAEIHGVKWVNDSKGTNVGATVAAIRGFAHGEGDGDGDGNGIVLIAGGLGKGADFTPLKKAAAGRVQHAVLFGEDAERMDAALSDADISVSRAGDLSEAVNIASARATAGQVVLFSPACASFDMFANYEERGRAFKTLVGELRQQSAAGTGTGAGGKK